MKNLYLIGSMLLMALLSSCGGDSKHKSAASPEPGSSSAMSSGALSSSSLNSSTVSSVASSSTGNLIKFQVVITNLTAGQPLSPTAVVLHKPEFNAFEVGMPASVELERIAESGNATPFLEDANTNIATYTSTRAEAGIPPGMTATLMLEAQVNPDDLGKLRLTALSMLGNTNDGFTGLNGIDISKIMPGSSMVVDTVSYDAGTEKNTETMATVPGPAANGEGFNPARDDFPATVAMHPGVLTKDDGNPDSVLTSINRWDNPVARIVITRLNP